MKAAAAMPMPSPALAPVLSPLLEAEGLSAGLEAAVDCDGATEADVEIGADGEVVEVTDVVVNSVTELVSEALEDATVYEATSAMGAGPENGSTQSKAPELVWLQQAQS